MGRNVKRKQGNTRTSNASLTVMTDSIKMGLNYSVDEDIVNHLLFLSGDASISQEDSN